MLRIAKRPLSAAIVVGFAMVLAACNGGGGSSKHKYTVGGTLFGLGGGLTVTLLNNGGNTLAVNANGSFTFSSRLKKGATYAVTVGTQPTGQTCTVSNGTGTVASANVSNVAVACANNAITYTIGGTLSGLGGGLSVTLLNNGGNSLVRNANGSFTFTTALATGAAYAVTVGTQPTGQTCTVSNGTGTIAAANVTNVGVACANAGVWTWKGGSNLVAPSGVYGTKGVPAASNAPGGRNWNASWTDSSLNLWIFGGQGYDSANSASALNDLWKYDPNTGLWTWVDGPNTIDAGGVYGVLGTEAAGNLPGARWGAVSWDVGDGYIWMFGGYGVDASGFALGYLNDLWRFNPANGRWTWMSGSNTCGAVGVYGTKGVSAATNVPGARNYMVAAMADPWTGKLWLFGGAFKAGGNALAYNDLWTYNTNSGQWTWVSGSSFTNASGVYGTKGTPAASNVPGARAGAIAWVNVLDDSFWIFGGAGYDSVGNSSTDLNDLWRYDNTGQWTWVNGSNLAGAGGVYGTLGTPSVTTQPGARDSGTAWRGQAGHFWLFGGAGYDSQGVYDSYGLNDIFEYVP